MNTPVNNESKIIDKIISDANLKADELLAQAKAVVDEKTKEATEKAKKESDIAIEAAKVEATKAAAKEVSSAQMLAKKKILVTKQELIEQAIQKAKEKLLAYSDTEKEAVILSMLKTAVSNKEVEVILSPKDHLKLKSMLTASGYKVSDNVRDILGGFILKDGDIEYNYSFEAIIAIQREELEQISANILFS
jgi:V/A-type H+-transporting ATPase subunit E